MSDLVAKPSFVSVHPTVVPSAPPWARMPTELQTRVFPVTTRKGVGVRGAVIYEIGHGAKAGLISDFAVFWSGSAVDGCRWMNAGVCR